MEKVYRFLEDHQDKYVKLTIGHCSNMDNVDITFYDHNGNYFGGFRQSEEQPILTQYRRYKKEQSEWEEYDVVIPAELPQNMKISNFLAIKPHLPEVSTESDADFDLDIKNAKKQGIGISLMEIFAYDDQQCSSFFYGANISKTQQTKMYSSGASIFSLEEGGFALFDKDIEFLVNYPSKNNSEYIWVVGEKDAISNRFNKGSKVYEELGKICKIREFPNAEGRDDKITSQLIGYFSGYFRVGNVIAKQAGDVGVYENGGVGENGGGCYVDLEWNSIELEPINKREFELKNY